MRVRLNLKEMEERAIRSKIDFESRIDTFNFIVNHTRTHLWGWSLSDWRARRILRHANQHVWGMELR